MSTEDAIGLICALVAWLVALIYFHTHPNTHHSPAANLMGWSLNDLKSAKVKSEGERDKTFKKTVNYPGGGKKFPDGTLEFSEPEISETESVGPNHRSKASYSVRGR